MQRFIIPSLSQKAPWIAHENYVFVKLISGKIYILYTFIRVHNSCHRLNLPTTTVATFLRQKYKCVQKVY